MAMTAPASAAASAARPSFSMQCDRLSMHTLRSSRPARRVTRSTSAKRQGRASGALRQPRYAGSGPRRAWARRVRLEVVLGAPVLLLGLHKLAVPARAAAAGVRARATPLAASENPTRAAASLRGAQGHADALDQSVALRLQHLGRLRGRRDASGVRAPAMQERRVASRGQTRPHVVIILLLR